MQFIEIFKNKKIFIEIGNIRLAIIFLVIQILIICILFFYKRRKNDLYFEHKRRY